MELDISPICRTCLSTEASKDISDLKSPQRDRTSCEIMFFCLSIQLDEDSKVSTKLCKKCLNKIKEFYKFKKLALVNDAHLKNLSKPAIINIENVEDVKNEEASSYADSHTETDLGSEIKLEPIKDEKDQDSLSDDELLSDIRKIKYEFISEINETKKNEKKVPLSRSDKTIKKKQLQICAECGKHVVHLKQHILRHERRRDPSTRLPCTLCDQSFSSYDARSKHRRKIHFSKTDTCHICGKVVKNLKIHIRNIHHKFQLPYECHHCSKRFLTKSFCEVHMRSHSVVRPYSCDECDKTFRGHGNLLSHIKDVHENERHFMCQYCSKSFSRGTHLRRHLGTHTKEGRCKCEKCGKWYATAAVLKIHMLTHSPEKTYACKLCTKSFKCSRYLIQHMLTHTREKRWQCSYCDLRFHRSDHRKQHEAALHKAKDLLPQYSQVSTRSEMKHKCVITY